jgi:hypothetical protein
MDEPPQLQVRDVRLQVDNTDGLAGPIRLRFRTDVRARLLGWTHRQFT